MGIRNSRRFELFLRKLSEMKIKFYIVTYKNSEVLNNWILYSLYNSNFNRQNVEVFVINNHSEFYLDDKYKSMVTVLHNVLRPDFSTGHLSRNYNQAIINGFKNLINPDCDVVITCQNDTKILPNWEESIKTLLKTYNYMSFGIGDQIQVFTAEGVKTTGLYDERFCGIGYQEADYFIRSYIYNKQKSSINDFGHRRVLNQSPIFLIEKTGSGLGRGGISTDIHQKSMIYHPISRNMFKLKWDIEPEGWNEWTEEIICKIPSHSKISNFILYPYFEKDIHGLESKNYCI